MIISHQERILNIADQIVLVANGSIKQIGTKKKSCLNLWKLLVFVISIKIGGLLMLDNLEKIY